jgi:exosortase B
MVQISQALAAIKSFAKLNVFVLLLVGAFIAAYIPTYLKLIAGPWRTEQEGHGPLIILAAAWLAWQCRDRLKSAVISPAPIAGWAILLAGLAMMIFTRALDILFLEVLSEIPVISGCIILLAGWSVFRILAFPIAFLVFSAPPPGWLLDAGTVPLKAFVSDLVTQVLYSLGYPIAQNGVMIMIGSYQLLVKDACAGMNSIFALSAIGIFYIYAISNGSRIHNLILLLSILPITIAANFVRVLALVLIAYYFGVDAIEGIFHDITGIGLFIVAVVMLLLLDAALSASSALVRRLRARPAPLERPHAAE